MTGTRATISLSLYKLIQAKHAMPVTSPGFPGLKTTFQIPLIATIFQKGKQDMRKALGESRRTTRDAEKEDFLCKAVDMESFYSMFGRRRTGNKRAVDVRIYERTRL